jgi:hypothetical protein
VQPGRHHDRRVQGVSVLHESRLPRGSDSAGDAQCRSPPGVRRLGGDPTLPVDGRGRARRPLHSPRRAAVPHRESAPHLPLRQ